MKRLLMSCCSLAMVCCIFLTSCKSKTINALWMTYSLEDLAEVAELVFTGTVEDVYYDVRTVGAADMSIEEPYAYYTIDVVEIFKGEDKVNDGRVNIKVPGNDPSENGHAAVVLNDTPVPLDIGHEYLFVLSAYDDVEGYDENDPNDYPSILNPYQSIFDMETDRPVGRIKATGNGSWEEDSHINPYDDTANMSAAEVIEQVKAVVNAGEWGNSITLSQLLEGYDVTEIKLTKAYNGGCYSINGDKIDDYISLYDALLMKKVVKMNGDYPYEEPDGGWPEVTVEFYANDTKIVSLLPLEYLSSESDRYSGILSVGYYDESCEDNWGVKNCRYNVDYDELVNILSWNGFSSLELNAQ